MTPGRPDLLVETNISPAAPDLRLVYVVRTSRYWSTPYIRHAGVYTPYHTVVHLVPTVLSTGVLVVLTLDVAARRALVATAVLVARRGRLPWLCDQCDGG